MDEKVLLSSMLQLRRILCRDHAVIRFLIIQKMSTAVHRFLLLSISRHGWRQLLYLEFWSWKCWYGSVLCCSRWARGSNNPSRSLFVIFLSRRFKKSCWWVYWYDQWF